MFGNKKIFKQKNCSSLVLSRNYASFGPLFKSWLLAIIYSVVLLQLKTYFSWLNTPFTLFSCSSASFKNAFIFWEFLGRPLSVVDISVLFSSFWFILSSWSILSNLILPSRVPFLFSLPRSYVFVPDPLGQKCCWQPPQREIGVRARMTEDPWHTGQHTTEQHQSHHALLAGLGGLVGSKPLIQIKSTQIIRQQVPNILASLRYQESISISLILKSALLELGQKRPQVSSNINNT